MKKVFLYLTVFCVIAFLLLVVVDFLGIGKKTNVTVDIPMGSSTLEIGEILGRHKIVNVPILFTAYSYLTGQNGKYYAGKHTFEGGSYPQLAAELREVTHPDGIVRVTIPEGSELWQIAQAMENAGVCAAEDFTRAANKKGSFDYWFIDQIPNRENPLEGYLFPSTYEFYINSAPNIVIEKMLKETDKILNEDIKAAAKRHGMSVDDIMILASIIERETVAKNELDLVSGVFHNRLNQKGESIGLLQSCATVQYILKERKAVLSIADTQIKSPYNTYINKGLPIGPIASPGKAAIEAAANPAETDYLYFVAKGDGTHTFSKTLKEHEAAQR